VRVGASDHRAGARGRRLREREVLATQARVFTQDDAARAISFHPEGMNLLEERPTQTQETTRN
jgi:hypothetical protein